MIILWMAISFFSAVGIITIIKMIFDKIENKKREQARKEEIDRNHLIIEIAEQVERRLELLLRTQRR